MKIKNKIVINNKSGEDKRELQLKKYQVKRNGYKIVFSKLTFLENGEECVALYKKEKGKFRTIRYNQITDTKNIYYKPKIKGVKDVPILNKLTSSIFINLNTGIIAPIKYRNTYISNWEWGIFVGIYKRVEELIKERFKGKVTRVNIPEIGTKDRAYIIFYNVIPLTFNIIGFKFSVINIRFEEDKKISTFKIYNI